MAEGGGASADKAEERGQLGRAVGWAICVARGAGQLKVGEPESGDIGEEHDEGLCHDRERRPSLLASIGVSIFSKVL